MEHKEQLLLSVQKAFGVTREQLMSPTRSNRDTAWARQVAMYLCHITHPSTTLTDVGLAFGRDRTTVRHACRKVEDLRDLEDLDKLLEDIERECTATPI